MILEKLPIVNFNTLKFHLDFFNEVISHGESNKMNAYNISVTVGATIFRPKVH